MFIHYKNAIRSAIVSQITSLTIVYSSVYSGADQRKHQSSASLSFVWGIHRWPVNSPHKGPVTRKSFHFMTSSCFARIFFQILYWTIRFTRYIWLTHSMTTSVWISKCCNNWHIAKFTARYFAYSLGQILGSPHFLKYWSHIHLVAYTL